MNYYNENDKPTAAWLRELIKAGLIPNGHVDERSITDVTPNDLNGFVQCHFFAGIGGWSYALSLAGWPEDREVWTGSCPCQPFSIAGKRKGTKDSRHLWPQFRRLIRKRRPSIVFGEQVAAEDGRIWLDGVFADLEALGFANCAADLCAAGIGAPQIRQRLYWMANAIGSNEQQRAEAERKAESAWRGQAYGVANSQGERRKRGQGSSGPARGPLPKISGEAFGVGNTDHAGPQGLNISGNGASQRITGAPSLGSWSNFELIPCADGKQRRIESGTFPLAHGVSGRVGLLRGYGNAIVPELAAEFIKAAEAAINQIECQSNLVTP